MSSVFNKGRGVVRASDGTRIFYTMAGEGQTTALFLHGWGDTGSGPFWSPVLRGLDQAKLRSVMVDLRGHGRSDHTRRGFTTEQFAQDVFDVVDQAGVKAFVVVAYSMSVRWAQWMSCTSPERVLGQILIAPVSTSPMPLTEAMADGWLRSIESRDGYHQFESQFTKERLAE
jgi:sigma-B regulation protein RsbQ